MRLQGKVAFVSGGARGIGAATARLFAREGACVAIGDVLEEPACRVVEQIAETGGQALFTPLDVRDEEQWRGALEATVNRFGKLDILVNNAGTFAVEALEDTSEELWDRVLDTNSTGVFLGTKAAIPYLRQNGGGSIINLSSITAIIGRQRATAYSAAKGAVRTFSRSVAAQYGKEGIRCNSVHPGFIETEMLRPLWSDPEMRAHLVASVPLGRLGRPEDVAPILLFLASDDAAYVTGAELVVDGGTTMV